MQQRKKRRTNAVTRWKKRNHANYSCGKDWGGGSPNDDQTCLKRARVVLNQLVQNDDFGKQYQSNQSNS